MYEVKQVELEEWCDGQTNWEKGIMEDDLRGVNVIDDKGQTGWTDTIRPTAQKQTTTVTNQQMPPARRFEVPGPRPVQQWTWEGEKYVAGGWLTFCPMLKQ